MKEVAIVTDSTAYIPSSILSEFSIQVVPLSVIWDGNTYADGIDISPEEFYTRLATSTSLPSTSQPSAGDFTRVFQSLKEAGKDIAAILISSGISGTVNSALQAQAELGADGIEIIDSQTAGMAAGLQVLVAAREASRGGSLEQVAALAQKARQQTDVVFAVDTLEFLHKGGRIGGAKRFLGTMLNIKPILEIKAGKIDALDQVRTQKRSRDRMIELIREKAGDDLPLRMAVMHSNVPEQAEALLEDLKSIFQPEDALLAELSPVIGTHVGPGTLSIACLHGI